jgi:hypothetical protein
MPVFILDETSLWQLFRIVEHWCPPKALVCHAVKPAFSNKRSIKVIFVRKKMKKFLTNFLEIIVNFLWALIVLPVYLSAKWTPLCLFSKSMHLHMSDNSILNIVWILRKIKQCNALNLKSNLKIIYIFIYSSLIYTQQKLFIYFFIPVSSIHNIGYIHVQYTCT